MRDISEDAAIIADMVPWVEVRFIEAVDTLEHIHVSLSSVPRVRSFWPAAQSTGSDNDPVPVVWRPTAAAISRSEEVLHDWLLAYVAVEEHRKLLLAWAASIARPKRYGSFARFCRKSGRARSTAYNRLASALSDVATLIRKNGKSLQAPDLNRVGQLARFSHIDFDKLTEFVSSNEDRPSWWRAADAVLQHMPETHEKPKDERRVAKRRAA